MHASNILSSSFPEEEKPLSTHEMASMFDVPYISAFNLLFYESFISISIIKSMGENEHVEIMRSN